MNPGIVVIGTSAGGFQALHTVLPMFPRDFGLPIVVVQHQHTDSDDILARSLDEKCHLSVTAAQYGVTPRPGLKKSASS